MMAELPPDVGSRLLDRLLDRAEAEEAGLLVTDLRGYTRDERITWRDLAAFLCCTEEALNQVALCRPPRSGGGFVQDVEAIAEDAVDAVRLLPLLRLLAFRRLVRTVEFTEEPGAVRAGGAAWNPVEPALLAARDADADDKDLLHQAAAQGMAEMVRHLLADGNLDPDAPDSEGRTALEVALRAGKASTAEALVLGGANVSFRTAEGATALHLAAHRGLGGLVARLLADGLDVNARDMGGLTPLHMAALGGDTPTVRLLLDAGADKAMVDANGRTPADLAEGQELRALLLPPHEAGD